MTRCRLVPLALGLTWLVLGLQAVADDPLAHVSEADLQAAQATLDEQVLPLLRQYCIDCHNSPFSSNSLDLSQATTAKQFVEQREIWDKAISKFRAGTMPPEGEERPSQEVATAMLDRFEALLSTLACAGPRDPGRVTVRRLNRVEYNNTIRDLVGIDYHGADDFPSDDVGYGFDNIGDVLSLSPVLLEKYLAAAEEITSRAIVTDDPSRPRRVRLEAEDMQSTFDYKGAVNGAFHLYYPGEVYGTFDAPAAGPYVVRARAFGTQAGDEPARMELRFDEANRQTIDVPVTEEAAEVYEAKFELIAGKHRIAAAFLNDFNDAQATDPQRKDRNLAVDYLEIEGPLGLEPAAVPESHRRIIFIQPEADTVEGCARMVLKQFATRAWRRPATSIEVSRLMRVFHVATEQGESFERGIQLACQAVLVSPYFLYRIELPPGEDKPKSKRGKDEPPAEDAPPGPLNPWALASRLSYFLWSSMPDEELFKLAEEGTLAEPAVLEAQVRRMLADPKSQALVENFAGQWLQLRNLRIIEPDRGRFPEFDEELRAAMRSETEQYFAHIMREDRSILEFLDADYTFVNERLARHYGINGVAGPEFRQVSLAGTQRGGVLLQASVLTVTSNPTRTSPVKRGRWVLEQILGTPPPPPPPGAPQLPDDGGGPLTGTLRQRTEQHRTDPNCAACHRLMDPLGFGLENFDAVGAWRDQDGADPIDASGELPNGRTFAGPGGLREILVGQAADFRRCLAQKLLTYALGRGLEAGDRCTVDEICQSVAGSENRFSALVLAIVQSVPFRGPAAASEQ
ncbi:MAG: DUF1592 domain-containing protein [Pirellulales bacterium]|nr:DUF1592 domain-containing protein [Pirellulales bacterium]